MNFNFNFNVSIFMPRVTCRHNIIIIIHARWPRGVLHLVVERI